MEYSNRRSEVLVFRERNELINVVSSAFDSAVKFVFCRTRQIRKLQLPKLCCIKQATSDKQATIDFFLLAKLNSISARIVQFFFAKKKKKRKKERKKINPNFRMPFRKSWLTGGRGTSEPLRPNNKL